MSRIARTRWLLLAGVLTVVALAVTACGGSKSSAGSEQTAAGLDQLNLTRLASIASKPAAVTQFVGKVAGTDAYIAVVDNRDGTVTVYVCNGNYDISAWLPGNLAAKAFELSSDDGIAVSGSIAGDVASGTVTLADGSKHAFSAERSSAPAGLFELVNVEGGKVVRAATIVLPDGTSRGGTTPKFTSAQCADFKLKYKNTMKVFFGPLPMDPDSDAGQEVWDSAGALAARFHKGGCSGSIVS